MQSSNELPTLNMEIKGLNIYSQMKEIIKKVHILIMKKILTMHTENPENLFKMNKKIFKLNFKDDLHFLLSVIGDSKQIPVINLTLYELALLLQSPVKIILFLKFFYRKFN